MIGFRHADPRFPFLWESAAQPPARWHGPGEGPAHYFCDTPDGAWAEFLRHEEIKDPKDLATIRRSVWAVDLQNEPLPTPNLLLRTLTGGPKSYAACQAEARRLRKEGARGLLAPSAALLPGGAHGWRVDSGLRPGPPRDGTVIVLFGGRPDLVGWAATAAGRPTDALLAAVRHFRVAATD
ncbi:MAG: RES family NAD+ phosphorylase [Deinococcus sp.]|nr:RES family NAD+ phosphorylase [Deinococcus sp.]